MRPERPSGTTASRTQTAKSGLEKRFSDHPAAHDRLMPFVLEASVLGHMGWPAIASALLRRRRIMVATASLDEIPCSLPRHVLAEPERLATALVHPPEIPGEPAGASSTPIYQTATFAVRPGGGWDYSRSGNPTRDVLERQLERIDGAWRSLAYASGLAAVAAVLRTVPAGGRVLASYDLYGGTQRLLADLEREGRLRVASFDPGEPGALAAALAEQTALVWLETPSNPRLWTPEIRPIARLAHGRGAHLAVDTSLASPLAERALDQGADFAVQSATKMLGGHSDLTAGVVSVNDPALAERLAFLQNAEGTALAPFEAWLLLRGLETLAVRLERQLANTARLAERLATHPGVRRLYQTPAAPLLAFETGCVGRSRRFLERCRLFRTTVSFGGVTSSASLPCTMSHASVPAAWRSRQALPEDLVRLAVGIEDPEDLWRDVERALGGAAGLD
jgi:cysteine-S-conjugate beta-lyase